MAANSRKIQQLIHQNSHALCAFLDTLQVALGPRVKSGPELLKQNSGKPRDMSQRGSQVMRNRVAKGFQFAVRGFEFGGALDHPLFQLIIKSADFAFIGSLAADITKRDHAAARFAVFILQRVSSCFDPCALRQLRVSHE